MKPWGVSVVLPLSKRVASLLSMVFCAKVTNPQELVDIEMETKLRTCAVPGQAHRVADVGLQGGRGGVVGGGGGTTPTGR